MTWTRTALLILALMLTTGVAGEGGKVIVIRATRDLEELARNDMGEALMATPAIASGTLYVRGRGALYAVARTSEPDARETSAGSPDSSRMP